MAPMLDGSKLFLEFYSGLVYMVWKSRRVKTDVFTSSWHT
jgi:hypothetical protein